MPGVDSLVEILWDYMLVGHALRPADCIFVLGSHDIGVADYGIELFQADYAPWLLFSGGVMHRNAELGVFWDEPEARHFARRALNRGLPSDRILIENRARNTGENFRFARQLVDDLKLNFRSFILVQKPYMERRVLATAKKLWPDLDVTVTSTPIACQDYLHGDFPRDVVIQHIVGDFQRIKVYGEIGFQTPQVIPANVWDAFKKLCALGYDKRLVR
jgi:uncharacterized SAM-binding protein YcdF (DUF218 family)